MGLSGYGKPIYKKFTLNNIIKWENDKIKLNLIGLILIKRESYSRIYKLFW